MHKSQKYNLVSYNDSSTISPFRHYHTSTTCQLTTITNMYRKQSTIPNTINRTVYIILCKLSRLETKTYPQDFNGITNQVQIYKCITSNKRIIISNGIPNHDVTLQNRVAPCEVNWAIEIPLIETISSCK